MQQRIQIAALSRTALTDRMSVELAHLIGFKSTAMEFPVLAPDTSAAEVVYFLPQEGEYEVSRQGNKIKICCGNAAELPQLWQECSRRYAELTGVTDTVSSTRLNDEHPSSACKPHEIPPFDGRRVKGLESLFDKDYILLDEDLDLLPDRVNMRIKLTEGLSYSRLSGICSIAARLGMETTCAAFPIVTDTDGTEPCLITDGTEPCALTMEENSRIFRLSGDGEALEQLCTAICMTFPQEGHRRSWVDMLEDISSAFAMENLDGQLTMLEKRRNDINENTAAYLSPGVHKLSREVTDYFKPARMQGYKDLKQVYQVDYDLPWEVDVCRQRLEEALWQAVKPGDTVTVCGVLSEDKAVRRALEKEMLGVIDTLGATAGEVRFLCAHKQGFSWLEEAILPQLQKIRFDKLEIAFKAFLPPGETCWNDENGATPKYNSIDNSDKNRWYDLPIRPLQELYPIDDLLAQALGIDRDKITFTEYTGEGDVTYQVTARLEDAPVYSSAFKANYHERPYLSSYPAMGLVHPGTGHIYACINGVSVLDERIVTDVEALWDVYQEEILPRCRQYCDEKTHGRPSAENQPLFAQLRLDIRLSEPDEPLPCREDVISSLNSLHEDIYFVGTDFFKVYGAETTGEPLDAPGLILPIITKASGKPMLRFTLFDRQADCPCIDFESGRVTQRINKDDMRIFIKQLRWQDDGLVPVISISGGAEIQDMTEHYAQLLEMGFLEIGRYFKNITGLCLHQAGEDRDFYVTATPCADPEKTLSIKDIDIKEYDIIGYEQYEDIISRLRHVKGIDVYKAGESYEGRDIHAIEISPDYSGYVSRVKRISRFPSIIILARHHANEVSGTNANLMLLRELLINPEFCGIAECVNIVIMPMENVDGAALHYKLQEMTPRWKLHIARYNAIGKEFYNEHFKHTIHTEANAFTRLWRRWLPDVVSDNHGVPSHEWEQPFSGYTAPSFKGFWLPRSLLYGYFWTVAGEEYAENKKLARAIEHAIAEGIDRDAEIVGWNEDWQDRFEKYAHAWMPKLFPTDYYRGMINYWIESSYSDGHRYPSVRFPWITTVGYTSEVADETAQGDYLHLCARTHVIHDLEILRMLRSSTSIFRKDSTEQGERIYLYDNRLRPLMPPEQYKNREGK